MTEQDPHGSPGPQEPAGGPSSPAPRDHTAYPYPGQPGWDQRPPAASGLTRAALVIGIIAVVLSVIPGIGFVSFLLGPLAVVLGIVALVKRRPRRGYAVTGVITGAVAIAACIVYAILAAVLFPVVKKAAGETADYTYTVTGEGPYSVNYLTDSIDNMATQEVKGGKFTRDVTASTLFGMVSATNARGNTGDLSCQITDAGGAVVSSNSASGAAAQVTCPVAEGMAK